MSLVAGQAVHVCSLCDIRDNGDKYGNNDELKNRKPLFLIWVIVVSKVLEDWGKRLRKRAFTHSEPF